MSYTPQPQVGRGTTISFTPTGAGGTAAAAFLSLASVTPPGIDVGEVENDLIANLFGDYLPTLPEGEGEFKVQHWDGDPGCTAMMANVQVAPIPVGTFVITLPSGATITFTGFPKGYTFDEITNKEIITATIPYRMKTKPIYAAPPSGS